MTDTKTLYELEELAHLAHHREMQALIDRYDALREIYDRDLWIDVAPSWTVYLNDRHQIKRSYWDNMQANVKAAKRAMQEFGVTLGNQQAAREFRTIFHRWAESDLLPAVVQKAQQVAGEGNRLQGKHLRAVMETTVDVVQTGNVWVEGEALPYNVAIDEHVAESYERQKVHAANGAQRSQWILTTAQVYTTDTDLVQVVAYIPKTAVPVGVRQIDIKWKVIEDDPLRTPAE